MRLTIASVCVFLFFAISLQAADGSKVFDVRQFGAKGDGQTLDTAAIQKALDECGKAAGGTVKFSRGTYLSQPLTLQAQNHGAARGGGDPAGQHQPAVIS